ncbi:Endoribonuclease dicer-like protein, partial [Thalictrum thalictroides]
DYIRDSAFDSRRWVAPGQRSLHPVSCECGVDTSDVPLESKFVTDDTKIMVGKTFDRGHRWMCSKTISDCVEALIGAYYVGGGLTAAVKLMKWLGIDAELEPTSLIDTAIFKASLWCKTPKENAFQRLESKLKYSFITKGLLLEAITHASQQELGLDYCYQRLEFLGDSVLDLLITWHLFESHKDIDPGVLTDLRSALVNNENFAQVALKYNLHQHLIHSSGLLSEQIQEYVKFVSDAHDFSSFQKVKCPKALGDLVESLAGAILIDTGQNLDNAAKGQASLYLLERLEERGIAHSRHVSRKNQMEVDSSINDLDINICRQASGEYYTIQSPKRKKITEDSYLKKSTENLPLAQDSCKTTAPVVVTINKKKGGPRSSLYELCKRMHWSMTTFHLTGQQSRLVS